jgi:tetratricopeptide (TPR) repeat protein
MKKIVLLQLLIIGILASCVFEYKNPKIAVRTPYKLRMMGRVDDAKAVLDTLLLEFHDKAIVHYEKARLESYMMVGGGDIKLEDVKKSIGLAMEYDPENVIYAYFNAHASFLDAYIAMQMGQGEVKELVSNACDKFEGVLELKPDYHEARLTLVEIYGLLPPDMGGDSEKASEYAEWLESNDEYFGAKARAILSSEETDLVKYWEDFIKKDEKDPRYLKEAGTACLYAGDPEKAEKYFTDAIQLDHKYNIQLLNLSRYHMYMVMQDQESAATELPLAKEYAEKYLETKPEPIVPLKAYTLGMLSRFERFLGNPEAAEKRMQEAQSLDPYFSRASGLPSMGNFIAPDEMDHHYSSYFGPF